MILIASSLSLLAIVAGMFLYAKTIKEELNRLFKIVSFFIIIVGFLNFFAGGAVFVIKKIYMLGAYHHSMGKECYGHHGNKMKQQKFKHMSCDGMKNENCEHRMKAMHCKEMKEIDADGCCPEMMGKRMMMDEKSCYMKGKMMMKKDSVIIKK